MFFKVFLNDRNHVKNNNNNIYTIVDYSTMKQGNRVNPIIVDRFLFEISLIYLSYLFLNSFTDNADTNSFESLFQFGITLFVKKFSLCIQFVNCRCNL